MLLNSFSVLRCLVPRYVLSSSQKRYRYKEKWATQRPKKSSCELAVEHFDTYYKPVFGNLWPSIRIALLSLPKYCALVNNFAADRRLITLGLAELGAHDIIHKARNTLVADASNTKVTTDESGFSGTVPGGQTLSHGQKDSTLLCSAENEVPEIDNFMPVKKIASEKERMREQDVLQNVYREPRVGGDVVDAGEIHIPFDLMAFAQDLGDISSFPPAKKDDSNKLGYYLMDAASLLPVVALGLEPGCEVLDLCAAPGGKSLAILQTLLPGRLTCVDQSYNRLKRLKEVLHWYAPKSYIDGGKVQLVNENGITFVAKAKANNSLFDRVLVDVPCYADRHALEQADNNIFRPSRLAERLEIPGLQKELLFAGIQSCRPGGVVVYSTCTLSPVQNDGIVAATLERIWLETDIDVVVEDMCNTTNRFASTFTFYNGSVANCFGRLVLPHLTANFGPMYFCRLRRRR